MTMEKVYTCDLCHEKKPPKVMWGLQFSNLYYFRPGAAESTDGTHICGRCMSQLRKWNADLDASKIPSYRFES